MSQYLPHQTVYNPELTDADVTALWSDLLRAAGSSSHASVPQSTHRELISAPSQLPFYPAFTPAPTTSMGMFTNLTTQPYLDVNAWSILAPYASSVAPQLVGDTHWTEDYLFPANSVAPAPNVVSPSSSATPPAYQDEWAWLFESGPSMHAAPSLASKEEGLIEPYSPANTYGTTTHTGAYRSPAEWGAGPATFAPTLALGKRRHDGDEAPVTGNYEMPPQKRAKRGKANGILKATRSATRTRHKPEARIPITTTISEPKEAGRGAERLATPNTQGIHHPSLLGPSFQQGWAVEASDEQLTWVEGSVEERAVNHIDSAVQQQLQQGEATEELFKIPRKFEVMHKALLVATPGDWERGTIQEIKCRLCPNTKLSTWEDFKPHCDTAEAHPMTISFCDHCGDFFARSDALKRHSRNPPPECRSATREGADAKRLETEKAHGEFMVRLEGFLRTGEDIGKPFSQIIKEKFPGSSKKYKRGGRV